MKIFLIGSNGQVGHELRRTLSPLGQLVIPDRAQCDLAQPDQMRACLRDAQPQVIVNAAAYTAVDRAEQERELAYAVNAVAPGVLAEEAAALGALLVHYSTDYVFDGSKRAPYTEDDAPCPMNVYGHSKWAGEQAIANCGARALILRTSWVYGAYGHNFVKTILRLAAQRQTLNVVNDQHGAPTSAAVVAEATAHMLRQWVQSRAGEGLYHLSTQGCTTWYEFAREVLTAAQRAGVPLKLTAEGVLPVSTAQYAAPAPRPAWSQLDTHKVTQTFGITLPHWRAALSPVLEQLFHELSHPSH